jgi:SanA protein
MTKKLSCYTHIKLFIMMLKMTRISWLTLTMLNLCLLLTLACNLIIVNNARGKLYTDIDSVPPAEYGLLLGTTPQTNIGRRQNQFFIYRIDAAEQIYKAGKIKKILISGDENSLDGVNEVECMRDSLVARGVDVANIVLDGKGYRTLDAVWRAVKVYNVHSFVVISQKFHNERAIYLAEHLGLETHNITGYNAADSESTTAIITFVREWFARDKVFYDIFTNKGPILEEK